MKRFFLPVILICCLLPIARAQNELTEPGAVAGGQVATAEAAAESASDDRATLEEATDSEPGLIGDATKRVDELAGTLDKNRTVQDLSTHILNPIYVASDAIAFPAFHWSAFALMLAGVVSHAFQLVLSKLVVLAKGSINLRAIMSDLFGLLMSALGLMLATRAATEHSTFAESPTGVLSSAAVGIVAGLILYRWNQAEEVEAAYGRQKKKKRRK